MCDHNTMLWGNTAYCVKLSGEDLSRYWNKIESAESRKCPYYHYRTKKVSGVTITNISQSLTYIMVEKKQMS